MVAKTHTKINLVRNSRMPLYEYHCEANNKTVEVRHGMSTTINNWGELCVQAGIDSAGTSAESPVKRIISGGIPMAKKSQSTDDDSHTTGGCGCC